MEPLSTICYLYTSKLTMNSLLVNYRGRDADVVIIGFTLITDHLATLHITYSLFTILGILYWSSLPFVWKALLYFNLYSIRFSVYSPQPVMRCNNTPLGLISSMMGIIHNNRSIISHNAQTIQLFCIYTHSHRYDHFCV